MEDQVKSLPPALSLLSSERPRNLGWLGSAGLLFGDWGTSRLYVLGLAFLVAGRSSFWLIAAMSVLILVVAWAYTQICRIYTEGGGVYTAARHRHKVLGVIGALLLFADYTVTASLSSLDAFHYFGLGETHSAHVTEADAGDDIRLERDKKAQAADVDQQFKWNSPGTWAILSLLVIGALNLMGPKHTAGPAIVAAVGMVGITLMVVIFALPQIDWSSVNFGRLLHGPRDGWEAFVSIVLALSGVEAIANLTGVMRKPVARTSSRAIWAVALEVAIFNLIIAMIMVATSGVGREAHKEDMLAYLAGQYVGVWGEWTVRIVGGILLLSAANTAIGALMGTLYVMSRDGELPRALQRLNGFGAPWIAGIIAASAPAIVLFFVHDFEKLAHLYAIGIVGAVAINCTLTVFHPRLYRWYRKVPMAMVGMLLICIWVTLAYTKLHALIFVTVILAVGLIARQITRYAQKRRVQPSLLRQAIIEQLPPGALAGPKILLSTAGSAHLAEAAAELARNDGAALVVCFVREVALTYFATDHILTIDTDPAAQALFIDFLEAGHKYGVPIIPVYDTGPNAAELIAEHAAMNGVAKLLIGTSRRGALHQLIKGSFQRKLESLLPPEIHVQVLSPTDPTTAKTI